MTVSLYSSDAFGAYLKKQGNGNIKLHTVMSPLYPENKYYLRCVLCNSILELKEYQATDLVTVEAFAQEHEHPLNTHIFMVPKELDIADEVLDGDPFNLLGDIKTQIGGTITAISSTSIKEVARRSNFNVDLQCRMSRRGPEYRATCVECNEYMLLTHAAILAIDKNLLDTGLEQFLAVHRHDRTEMELPKGRKFRHAT